MPGVKHSQPHPGRVQRIATSMLARVRRCVAAPSDGEDAGLGCGRASANAAPAGPVMAAGQHASVPHGGAVDDDTFTARTATPTRGHQTREQQAGGRSFARGGRRHARAERPPRRHTHHHHRARAARDAHDALSRGVRPDAGGRHGGGARAACPPRSVTRHPRPRDARAPAAAATTRRAPPRRVAGEGRRPRRQPMVALTR